MLIKHGANPNTPRFFGSTIFSFMGKGRYRKKMLLLKKKYGGVPTIHPRDNSSLYNAVLKKNYAAIEAAKPGELEKIQGRSSDGVPVTPVHMAVIRNDEKILKILFKKKINLNVRDAFGGTPLHWAVLREEGELAGGGTSMSVTYRKPARLTRYYQLRTLKKPFSSLISTKRRNNRIGSSGIISTGILLYRDDNYSNNINGRLTERRIS